MEIDNQLSNNIQKKDQKIELKILLLSDIHFPTDNIAILKQWHMEKNNGINYDYIFVSGDICNLPNNKPEPDFQADTECEGQLQALFMNDLEGFADDLLYIPGNHDPSSLFARDRNELPILSSNPSGNIHRGIYKLHEDLVIIGLGGSIQNFVQEKGEGPLIPCWSGFPYNNEDKMSFKNDLYQLWDQTLEQYPDPKTQIMIMTHEGPRGSSTAKIQCFHENMKTYVCGSVDLTQLIINNTERVLCNIHGHTHDGSTVQNIWKMDHPVQVINPGSLSQGEFAELILKKTVLGKWKISQINKHYL